MGVIHFKQHDVQYWPCFTSTSRYELRKGETQKQLIIIFHMEWALGDTLQGVKYLQQGLLQ